MIEFCDTNLALKTDLTKVRKIYKLNSSTRVVGNKQQGAKSGLTGVEDEVALRELEMAILGLTALRGAG